MPAPLFTSNAFEYKRLEGLYITEVNPPGFVRERDLSTVGIFGRCVRGPVDTPVVVTSEGRFLEVFGGRDLTADGTGGARVGDVHRDLLNKPFGTLVIVRAAASDAVAASFNQEDGTDGTGTEIIKITASSVGLWGGNVKFLVENATDGNSNHFNITIRYLGSDVKYENLDVTTGNNNLLTVLGDDFANSVVITKLADGRPSNNASFTGAYASALDANGFMNLGTVVAGYTSVAASDGTFAATDYTGTGRALDKLKEYRGVGVVFCSEDATEATVDTVNTAMITAAAASSDRLFLLWSGNYADSIATVISDVGAFTRNDRWVFCFNAPYTLDPDTATQIQTPPHAWMASILSQNDVDINPGEESTKTQTAGITKLTDEGITRSDYILLREAGISALEKDSGFSFVSAVTGDLTPGKTEITRRRSADFLQLSASDFLKFYVKKKNLAETRRLMGGAIVNFSQELQDNQRVIEAFEVDQESVNTAAQRAQGLEFILWRVRLIGHMLYIVLKTEIGTGVTIEA